MTSRPDGNLALKCTFNDDRSSPGALGFISTCSNQNIDLNVFGPSARVWCSLSPCAAYRQIGFQGPPPSLPCYESALFTHWRFGTGVLAHGTPRERMDVPRYARIGKIALLTTRFPGDPESERIVIGALNILDIQPDYTWGPSTLIQGDPATSFRAPSNVLLRYWSFKSGSPRWNHHLYRYVADVEVASYLRAMLARVSDPATQTKITLALNAVT